jgi:single-strand DNA-binding protein
MREVVVNKAIILGNLGKDPELRFTPSGRAVARFPVATTERWTDQNKERQERTDWHNIVVWGKQAETCSQYLSKGRQVYVEGSIRTRSYDDKDGNKRYVTEIVARDVRFLGGGGGGAQPRVAEGGFTAPAGEEGPPPIPEEEDTPF